MPLDPDVILHGDCLEVLKHFPPDSCDALVTDPPAGVGMLGKNWDKFQAANLSAAVRKHLGDCDEDLIGFQEFLFTVFRECLRVLKPGSHGVIWALPRTSHHTGMALERAGFEIRECLPHLFGSGMPKSVNIANAISDLPPTEEDRLNDPTPWKGWGTALKPSSELWFLVRKPLLEQSIARQVLTTGTGAINIDACRVPHANAEDFEKHKTMVDRIREKGGSLGNSWKNSSDLSGANEVSSAGRWPCNALLSHSAACVPATEGAPPQCAQDCPVARLDAQSGTSVSRPDLRDGGKMDSRGMGWRFQRKPSSICDVGGASRFFTTFRVDSEEGFRYCPKPSPSEKDAGGAVDNNHPTVKPLALMRWFCKLVAPNGAVILDPFAGSGTTCVAAVHEGQHFVGVEQDQESLETARVRVGLALTEVKQESVYVENYEAQDLMPQEGD